MLGSAGRDTAHGKNEVHLQTDQLVGEAEVLVGPFCLTVHNGEVLSFHIAKLTQTLAEGGKNVGRCQITDPVDLPRLLRFGGQRPGEQSEG